MKYETPFFSFKGRISKNEYIHRYLIPTIIPMAILILVSFIELFFIICSTAFGESLNTNISSILVLLLMILIPICWVSAFFNAIGQVKRFHDIGITGWIALLNLIQGATLVLMAICALVEGNKGENKYGDEPLK